MSEPDNESLCNKIFLRIKHKVLNFGDQSSLHGIGYVLSIYPLPFFKRLFWLTIMICCCLGAGAILRGALSLYSGNVVSYSVETNYLNFDTPFPALTVCEDSSQNDRAKEYLIRNQLPLSLLTLFKENQYWNSKYCRRCSDCEMNVTCVDDFMEHVMKIRLNCSQMLTKCWWDKKPFNCCDRFDPIETEYGVCFVFNSRVSSDNVTSTLTVNQKVGLPRLEFTTHQIVQLRVHAPEDLVTISMENILTSRLSSVPLTSDYDVYLKAEQIISDPAVLSLPLHNRGCLTRFERPDHVTFWPFKEYSYNTCLMYCRAKIQIDLCNCTHRFLPKLGTYPSCGLEGSACLSAMQGKGLLKQTNCSCPMSCEETTYEVVHVHYVRHLKNVGQETLKRGTLVTVGLTNLPTLRVVRRAIRDTLGFVVDIGGVGGVFFGASLLSVIEIVYLLFIRREH